MRTLNRLFGRSRRYDDLSVSIQEHIDERTEELMEEGMPRKEAEQKARREFGNVTLIQERGREVWQWAALESVRTDLRLVFRRLGKSPGFTVTVLLTLAIGIGANTAVFSVVNRVLLRPLPYPDSDRLVSLWLNAPGAAAWPTFPAAFNCPPPCISPSPSTPAHSNPWGSGRQARQTSPARLSPSRCARRW